LPVNSMVARFFFIHYRGPSIFTFWTVLNWLHWFVILHTWSWIKGSRFLMFAIISPSTFFFTWFDSLPQSMRLEIMFILSSLNPWSRVVNHDKCSKPQSGSCRSVHWFIL
jgi:hypothetical protein